MSIINNGLLLASEAAGAGGYQVSRSLRFNSSDSAYLSRTPASAGNRKTWTWAGWVKRSALGGDQVLFGGCPNPGGADNDHYGLLISGDALWSSYYTGSQVFQCVTSAVLRDTSAWYHITVAFDTTQATASNRINIYVNGGLQSLSTANYPSLNYDGQINSAIFHSIGKHPRVSSSYLSGYLADIHFIDGQALTPSSFAETNATTGQWVPKAYTGSYGTNGFRLTFSDNSGTTSTTLGKDAAGSNNWTPNNFSVASGSGNDSLVDTPTSYGTDTGAGGEVRGNYCTWNPLSGSLGTYTLSNGNLDTSNGGNGNTYSTFELSSGKWYFEATLTALSGSTASTFIGLTASAANRSADNAQNLTPNVGYTANGNKVVDASGSAYGASFTSNDVIGVAVDIDGGSITFYKNGTSQGAISKTFVGAGKGAWAIFTVAAAGSASNSWSLNAGQRAFAYTAPSGFKALCDTNLTAPTIAKPNTVMDVKLYTGTAATQSITGLGFSPDFVWIKNRNGTAAHHVFDIVRGAAKRLITNGTQDDSYNAYDSLTSFDTSGFTLGADTSTGCVNNPSGATYVAWAWDAGTSTVTNNNGTISSQVRANASAGFSVVSWSANNTANQSIGHGLGVTPAFIIHKNRTTAGNWNCWFTGFSNDEYINLNGTGAKANTGGGLWYQTPTSSLFYIGFTGSAINNSTDAIISYCFAPVAGYSSGFSYTGNGSADGSFVYLGFRPRLILLKCSSTTGNWTLLDTARAGYNVDNDPLYPNLSNAEGTTDLLDITSNGFKLRTTDASVNSSGATYVGFAWAEAPFQYARAR